MDKVVLGAFVDSSHDVTVFPVHQEKMFVIMGMRDDFGIAVSRSNGEIKIFFLLIGNHVEAVAIGYLRGA